MEWQNISVEEVLKKLKVEKNIGLDEEEVRLRQERFGKNILKDGDKFNFFKKFIEQFFDFMVIVLLFAALISLIVSFINKNNDYIDSIIILVIVISNAIIGVAQESKAQKAIDSLKKLSKSKTRVLRDSREQKISSEEIVPGDILLLESGDKICADARILKARNLRVEESVLTGESSFAKKNEEITSDDTPVLESPNMIFSGSFITFGRSIAVAVETAMNTQIGKVARLINRSKPPQTPLQLKLADMGRKLGIGTISICTLIFILGLFQNISILEIFMISISLAVAAIPEGLTAVITIALANGVKRMAKNNVIVRKLPAVETLGSANIICTDKTGTLTQNKMTVTEIYDFKKKLKFESPKVNEILNLAILCSNAKQIRGKVLGDPTEVAILSTFIKLGKNKSELEINYMRVKEFPFDSEKKMMTTVNKIRNGYKIISKGAPEVILKICNKFLSDENNNESNIEILSQNTKLSIIKNYESMASRALRVIAIAYKDQSTVPTQIENNFIFVGLIGIIDPPRPEAKMAVKACIDAGIKPVMVTGDHILTAKAIGKELGIFVGRAIIGRDLDKMSQKTLEDNIFSYSIFARVSPEHKVRIVKAFQARDSIVAMTGDGVNDAPALKISNIGCAMGTGTDVAKSASDMILIDDNFSGVVEAAKQGRCIYKNIKKSVHFLISTNIGEIVAVLIAFLMRIPSPLLAIQLLWINLVTDSFPALALVMDPIDVKIIKDKPASLDKNLICKKLIHKIFIEGFGIGIICVISFLIGRNFFDINFDDPITGRTMAFMTIGLSQLAHAFNVRSEKSIFKTGIFGNIKLIFATLMCTFLQIIVTLIPKLNELFKTEKLNILQWLIVLSLSFLPIFISEFEKFLFKKFSRKTT
ncbi:MAG: calcium-translocating P-type ATPase, PMCA-type [Firmicutes bacterium]|nr:calcium-translocating P-type ATPase, PMCA-type [Bacillota bacterium]